MCDLLDLSEGVAVEEERVHFGGGDPPIKRVSIKRAIIGVVGGVMWCGVVVVGGFGVRGKG